jgi:hypothetical protein
LDPHQIFKLALKSDDIDLAKSIKNYPVALELSLLYYLGKYDANSVSDYIYNNIIITYDPTYILKHISSHKTFKKIFKIIIDNDLDFNCEKIYRSQYDDDIKNEILDYMYDTYSVTDYEKFTKTIGL